MYTTLRPKKRRQPKNEEDPKNEDDPKIEKHFHFSVINPNQAAYTSGTKCWINLKAVSPLTLGL